MGEPEDDDKAKQAAREVGNERKEVLAKLLAPSNTLGLLSLYVGFVGTVVAFGVLAFYTGHRTTQEIAFFVSAILVLILPIGALWYLLPIFIKRDTLGKLLNRINQSSISKSLARFGNNRIVRLFNFALYAFMIADTIYTFPKHPRFSLVFIVIYVALSFAYLILWVSESIKREIYTQIYERILKLLEIIEGVRDTSRHIAERSLTLIERTEKSHSEAHETSTLALRAVNDAVQELARFVAKPPPQIEKEPNDR
jgi:sensor histidine kinase YesM